MRPLAIGDRVTITGRSHPHRGRSGVIAEPLRKQGLDWIIELDGAYEGRAAAAESELRREP